MTEGTHYITYDLHVLRCVYLWYKCWCGRAHLLKARGGCQVPFSVTLILSLRQNLSLFSEPGVYQSVRHLLASASQAVGL